MDWTEKLLLRRPTFWGLIGLWAIVSGFIGALLVSYDAFDTFYAITREHEDWELDEYIIILFVFLIGCVAILAMVSARSLIVLKREIEVRTAMERELSVARHLQSLGTLTAGLAHSANNLMQPILTLTRMTRDDLKDRPEAQQDLQYVLQAAQKATRLFEDVLAASRARPDQSSSADLVGAVRSGMPLIRTALPSSIDVAFDLPEDVLIVGLSRTEVLDVLLALASNSADAIKEQAGAIRFCVERVEEENDIDVAARLRIEDNGIGIPSEIVDRVYDPFFTTKEVGKGTGLGLSVVFGLAQKAGGKMAIDSRPGEGTAIDIVLPLHSERPSNTKGVD